MTKTITLDTDLIRRDNMIHHLENVNAQQAERIKALEALIEQQVVVLKWYGDPENWSEDSWGVKSVVTSPEYGDPGKMARLVLKGGGNG